MKIYTCEKCNKSSKVKLVWSDHMEIEGTLYYIENSRCEHCKKVTTLKQIKLT